MSALQVKPFAAAAAQERQKQQYFDNDEGPQDVWHVLAQYTLRLHG